VSESQTVQISQGLAEVASRLVQAALVDGLVLTGGDTAIHVTRRIGADHLILEREVEPGIPLGRLGADVTLPVVTKAGGFGSDDALVHAMNALKEPA
jgi:D-threonate/D-erythronate kinase